MFMDEITLILEAKKGDLFAYNELVLAYQKPVFNLALRMLGDGYLAEDVTQEVFITAFANLGQFKGGSIKNWLLRSCANRCIDEIRKQKRRPQVPLQPATKEDEPNEEPNWLRDESADPATSFEQKEISELIERCIRELREDARLVILLVDVFEMDYEEARQVISAPLGTLKSRLIRARESVRKCLITITELYPGFERYKSEHV